MFGQNKNSSENRKFYVVLIVLLAVAIAVAAKYFAPQPSHVSTSVSEAQLSPATPTQPIAQTIESAGPHVKHKIRPPHVAEQKIVTALVDANGYSQKPVALTWNDESSATSYTVEISGDFNFGSLTYTHETKTADLAVKKIKKGRYFWRVVAHRPDHADQISNIGDFILIDKVPRVREPAQSADSTTIVQTQIAVTAEATPEPTPQPIATPQPAPPALAIAQPPPTIIVAPVTFVPPPPPPVAKAQQPAVVFPQATPEPQPQPVAQAQAPVIAATPTPPSHVGVRLGFGLSSIYENITENLSDVVAKYHKTLSPGVRAEAAFEATDAIDIEALYRQAQIHFDNSSIGDKDTNGQWNTLGANLSVGTKHGEKEEWRWKIGAGMEQLPLNLFNGAGTAGIVRNLQFTEVAVGVAYRRNINPWTRFTIDGNLKYPISSSSDGAGSSVTVRPQVFLDTDVGLDKMIFKNGWLGLHWVGTYRAFNFTYADQIVTNGGNEKFFLSAFELRFSFEF